MPSPKSETPEEKTPLADWTPPAQGDGAGDGGNGSGGRGAGTPSKYTYRKELGGGGGGESYIKSNATQPNH